MCIYVYIYIYTHIYIVYMGTFDIETGVKILHLLRLRPRRVRARRGRGGRRRRGPHGGDHGLLGKRGCSWRNSLKRNSLLRILDSKL